MTRSEPHRASAGFERPSMGQHAGIDDETFEAALDAIGRRFDDRSSASDITILIKFEGTGVTLSLRDREAVAHMLKGELERRRALRRPAS